MSEWSKKVIIFDHNRINRPYIGGKLLHEWRGMEAVKDGHSCEELLVTSIGAICKGKPDGYAISKSIPELDSVSLRDIIASDPEGILGKAHQSYNPNQLSVLARCGDTIVRLVLQCHPKARDAKRFFHSEIGKSEAWYMVATREVEGSDNCIYAGFKKGINKKNWAKLCAQQNVTEMINCLHKLAVKQGDVILIPAGMPHAVGPGCLFLELHECSDITIRAERNINGVTLDDQEMFNGLNFEQGILLFDDTTYDEDEIKNLIFMKEKDKKHQGKSTMITMIDEQDTKAFGMQILNITEQFMLAPSDAHRILICVEHDIIIVHNNDRITMKQGYGALLPANLSNITIVAPSAKVLIGLPTVL